MLRTCLFLFLLFLYSIAHTQTKYDSKEYTQQLELRHDNDFFTFTDRYYSSGILFTYRTILKKGVFGDTEQLSLRLGQEVYTPSQTQSTNSNEFDRPYAGYTGFTGNWSFAQDNSLYDLGVSIGLVGNNSGAGGFQRWYHRVVAILNSPLWIDELNNSFHVNFHAIYTKEWEWSPNPFGVRAAVQPKLAIGSRDIFAETEGILFFGRRNSIGESTAYNRLGSNAREIYFTVRLAYRQVFYNGLLEGNLFGDNSTVLRESRSSLLRFGMDFNHRFDRNDYKIGIRYNSPETPESSSHIYLQFSYGFAF